MKVKRLTTQQKFVPIVVEVTIESRSEVIEIEGQAEEYGIELAIKVLAAINSTK
jgi:hypothetical protein